MDKNLKEKIMASVITIIFGLLGLLLVIKLTNLGGSNANDLNIDMSTITPVEVKPSQYPDYNALSDLNALELISGTTSTASDKDNPKLTKYIEVRGDFTKMYLFADVSINSNSDKELKPLTDWDSLYVKFNTNPPTLGSLDAGGHLYRPKSLKVPESNESTRLLFNMSVVPYIPTIPYSESRTYSIVNWFENIFRNPTDRSSIRNIRFDAFVSTTEMGIINLIALYYKCHPETSDCYIKIKNTPDPISSIKRSALNLI